MNPPATVIYPGWPHALFRAVEQSGSHVVMGGTSLAERPRRQKDSFEEVRGRIGKMFLANRHEALRSEALLVHVHRIGDSVGAEQNGVARLEAQYGGLVTRAWPEPGRNARQLEQAAARAGEMQRPGHSSARDLYLASRWIEHRVLQGGMPRRKAADHQPPVHGGKNLIRGNTRLVYPAESSDR